MTPLPSTQYIIGTKEYCWKGIVRALYAGTTSVFGVWQLGLRSKIVYNPLGKYSQANSGKDIHFPLLKLVSEFKYWPWHFLSAGSPESYCVKLFTLGSKILLRNRIPGCKEITMPPTITHFIF